MNRIQWADNSKDKIKAYINLLLNVKEQQEGKKGMPVSPNITMIMTEIAASISNYKLLESELLPVISALNESKKRTIEAFEKECLKYIKKKNHILKKKRRRWRVFLPIETHFRDVKLPFNIKILDQNYYIVEAKSIIKHMGKRRYEEAIESIPEWDPAKYYPEYFISTIIDNATKDESWNKVVPSFDVLRGVLEYSINRGRWRMLFGRQMQSRQAIMHPRFMIKYTAKEFYVERFYYDESTSNVNNPVTSRHIGSFIHYGNAFRNLPQGESILNLLADSLRLYAQALDQRTPHLCFLGLWQMAELLTLSKNYGGSTKHICRRLNSLWINPKFPNNNILNTIERFAEKRNNIVHRGIHEVVEDDINILKHLCEVVFDHILYKRTELNTAEHLEYYYSVQQLDKKQIKSRDDVHKLIRSDAV